MLTVAGTSLAATMVPPATPQATVVMLVGDSVPLHLQATFEEETSSRGWRLVSAARGACSVTGEQAVAENGKELHESSLCPRVVRGLQDDLIARTDPDVVLWWDRWSIADFLSPEGDHVTSGTPRFWRLRTVALREGVERLAARGARVVLVATEPPGSGIDERSWDVWWVQFQTDRYDDVTTRWNEILRRYASRHPQLATFMSITDLVCLTDDSPCDDRIDGVPARPDGIHYEGAGATLVSARLAEVIAAVLRGRPA